MRCRDCLVSRGLSISLKKVFGAENEYLSCYNCGSNNCIEDANKRQEALDKFLDNFTLEEIDGALTRHSYKPRK